MPLLLPLLLLVPLLASGVRGLPLVLLLRNRLKYALTRREVIYIAVQRLLKVEGKIRTIEVSNCVSRVSSIRQVREKLVAMQQAMGRQRGVVMDGRDIGTVVFPDAELKIFMTADPKVRAGRRYDELRAKGDDVSLEEIERNVRERDRADMSRAVSPLRQADDAVVLDNSHMTVEEQMTWFMERFDRIACGR